MLMWDRYRFQKRRIGTHYAELVFMHPVGYAGHLVHCGAFGACNIDVLFFLLGWDWYEFHKMRRDTRCRTCVFAIGGICGSRRAFLCLRRAKRRHTSFRAREGLVLLPQKVHQDKLRQTCVFASSGICGSRSAFRCIRGAKCRCTIFHAHVELVWIPLNACRDVLH
jgi:hypothetical protein